MKIKALIIQNDGLYTICLMEEDGGPIISHENLSIAKSQFIEALKISYDISSSGKTCDIDVEFIMNLNILDSNYSGYMSETDAVQPEIFNFEFKVNDADVSLKLFNGYNEIIYDGNNTDININVPRGLYMLRITLQDGNFEDRNFRITQDTFDEYFAHKNITDEMFEDVGMTGEIVDLFERELTQEEWNALCVVHRMRLRLDLGIRFDWSKSIDVRGNGVSQIVDEEVFLNKEIKFDF